VKDLLLVLPDPCSLIPVFDTVTVWDAVVAFVHREPAYAALSLENTLKRTLDD
jgi:hypothetical protein